MEVFVYYEPQIVTAYDIPHIELFLDQISYLHYKINAQLGLYTDKSMLCCFCDKMKIFFMLPLWCIVIFGYVFFQVSSSNDFLLSR